jgi:integrase/recombinase XerD
MDILTAIDGFLFHLRAEGYSQSTINLYTIVLKTLCKYLNNPIVSKIKYHDLQAYMLFLQEEYKPRRLSGNQSPLTGSSRQNHWKGIRCFFNWYSTEYKLKIRPDALLKLPKNNPKVVLPLSPEEIKAIIKVISNPSLMKPSNRSEFYQKRRTETRDMALVMLMLDTGLRVGEVCRLNIGDSDLESGQIIICPFGNSKMKTRGRVVYIGKNVRKLVWRYLSLRTEKDKANPLFLTEKGKRITVNSVRCLIADLGKRAGINNCHPHRFRHTFAIEFLRNSGDVFSLQRILGHSTLQMVENYVSLASCDISAAHQRASPADKY